MQIKITNADFSFGDNIIFENLNLEINNNDKIAIIGKNGSGKSTLFKFLTGEYELHQKDNALSVFQKIGNPTIGTLNQITFDNENISLYDELLKCYSSFLDLENKMNNIQKQLDNSQNFKLVEQYSKLQEEYMQNGGYKYRAELDEIIDNFGFTNDKLKKLCEFSGGQKTKIAFIKLILSKPDLLLLDEPTNHLDIQAITWLENFILSYKKAVCIISHDRTFLDNTVNTIYELKNFSLTKYVGNYSDYLKSKEINYDSALKAYEAQQRKIADIKEFIERFRYKATKASAVQSRIKMLEKMEILEKPKLLNEKTFKQKITPNVQSGNDVLSCTNLKIGYNSNNPLATINININRKERLGIIGGNGLGKSTFLNTLTQKINPISGHFKFGYNVEYEYFDQTASKIESQKTIYEDFSTSYPNLKDKEIRSALGAFLFSGNDVNKKLNSLSGGEIVRFKLCKILQNKPNLLLLDEPTNHLDIASKEALENMLLGFEGTIMFISHDRYFTNKIATKLLIFEKDNTKIFEGTYNEYIHPTTKIVEEITKKIEQKSKTEPQKEKIEYPIDYDDPIENKFSNLSQFELTKEKNKLLNKIEKIEQKSKDDEINLKELNEQFVSDEFAGDFVKLMEIQEKIENVQKLIEQYTDEYINMCSDIEIIEHIQNNDNN